MSVVDLGHLRKHACTASGVQLTSISGQRFLYPVLCSTGGRCPQSLTQCVISFRPLAPGVTLNSTPSNTHFWALASQFFHLKLRLSWSVVFFFFFFNYLKASRASLVAQWLRVCLPMQGTRVRALVWEDPTCLGATGPVSHNYWACMSGACAPQRERPRQWEARAPRWRVAPARRN